MANYTEAQLKKLLKQAREEGVKDGMNFVLNEEEPTVQHLKASAKAVKKSKGGKFRYEHDGKALKLYAYSGKSLPAGSTITITIH